MSTAATLPEGLRRALVYSSTMGLPIDGASTLLMAVLGKAAPDTEIAVRADTLLEVLDSMASSASAARAVLLHLRHAVHMHFGLPLSPEESAAYEVLQS